MAPKTQDPVVTTDPDAPGPPIELPESMTGDGESEGGKLKMIVQLVKKCLGVKDIAAMRLSLPASLLEPVGNLEFTQYVDRPDLFAAINDHERPFDRLVALIRFTFTKDLKFIHGKVCKPYNSVLGEHFRAHWDITPISYVSSPTPSAPEGNKDIPVLPNKTLYKPAAPQLKSRTASSMTAASDTASLRSVQSSMSALSLVGRNSSSTGNTSIEVAGANPPTVPTEDSGTIRVVYLTEQISHHPPVSVYYADCPARHISLMGVDQMSARVSGTTVRCAPGTFNKGIFIKINGGYGEGEEYRITHPTASINGILRGSFYVTVGESTIITVSGGSEGAPKLRAILEYKEQSWLGKPHFLVEGVIHTVHETDNASTVDEWIKVKMVPKARVVAQFEGSWKGKLKWKRTEHYWTEIANPHGGNSVASSPNPSHVQLSVPGSVSHVHSGGTASAAASKLDLSAGEDGWIELIDLSVAKVIPKQVRPLEKQDSRESRRMWDPVTSRLLKKEYSDATREKVVIEQRQRDEANERKKKGTEWTPKFFKKEIDGGYAALTPDGVKALEDEMEDPTPAPAIIEGRAY